MTMTDYDVLSLIIGIISLILLLITTIAGIKYVFSNWKINKLAKKLGNIKDIDRNSLQNEIQKISVKQSYKNSAKNIIEGRGRETQRIEQFLRSFEHSLLSSLDNINDTLKRFNIYEKPTYIEDISGERTPIPTKPEEQEVFYSKVNSKQKEKKERERE